MDITERFHQLRGAVHITRARTGKDSSMVVWGANVADLTALLDIATQVQDCIDCQQFRNDDPDAFWMEWAKLRDMVAKLTEQK